MRILNVRLGHANNSSSSHSMICSKRLLPEEGTEGYEFGWNYFTASSRQSKAAYLAITLRDNLQHSGLSDETAAVVVTSMFPEVNIGEEGYIDHQSLITLPMSRKGARVNLEFLRDLSEFVMKNGVVILGGNDDGGGPHPSANEGKSVLDELPREEFAFIARKDPKGYWTLFKKSTGAKIRLTFDDTKVATKATAPELVDLKITDYCPFGCEYCYQGSTLQGKHASLDYIRSRFYTLEKMGVFEVAIGGGEPTMHPDFLKILESGKREGLNVNFTTKNLKWLKNPEAVKQVMEFATSFAFSVSSEAEMQEVAAAYGELGLDQGSMTVQLVMSTMPLDSIAAIAETASKKWIPVTFLGYKLTGRGQDFKPYWPSASVEWERLKGINYGNFSIDTALAARWKPFMKKSNVPDLLYHVEEGKFSCYIDAVSGKMGPSSFCDASEMVPVPHTDEEFLETFGRM